MKVSDGIDLNGHVALITGASRGIGRAIALTLGKAGAAVAVNYRTHPDEAGQVVTAIQADGQGAVAVQADVSKSDEVAAMMKHVQTQLGTVDILVNNAGIATPRETEELDEREFDRTLNVNLKSAFLCTQAVIAGMRAKGWGRIINLSSVAARGGGAIGVHYNASKAGLEGLTRGYALRLAPAGITVNAIAPGPIDTDMAVVLPSDIASRVPMGRLGTAEEVAQAALLTIVNEYMTGHVVQVNGGLLFT